jgi:hypothetical protein
LHRFTPDGTSHDSAREQGRMNRRCIIWRNNHAYHERLRQADWANVV